jgi:hypothetical protein
MIWAGRIAAAPSRIEPRCTASRTGAPPLQLQDHITHFISGSYLFNAHHHLHYGARRSQVNTL